jgi:hypothetical protein
MTEQPASSSSRARKQPATPVKAPAKRNKIRRVVSSSSLPQSSPAANGERVATPGSLFRPLEIKESPEPTSPGALNRDHQSIEDSPLFVPQDSPLVIPSQDLAFVRPSEPPSSYQEFLGPSQSGASQSLPNSASTPPPAEESAADTPAVLATSQNEDEDPANYTPDQPSTGRVIPDSQSLPTSLDFASQLQANQDTNDSQEAAAESQLIGDLQGAAEGTTIASPPQPKTATILGQSQNQPSSLPSNNQSLPAPKPSEAPASPVNPNSQQQSARRTHIDEPDFVTVATGVSSGINLVLEDPSELNYRVSIEKPESQASVSASHHVVHEEPETQISFPFETQVAPVESQVIEGALNLSNSLPPAGRKPISQIDFSSLPRAYSLPGHAALDSSSFAPIPSRTLSNIGDSAPLPPNIPSTPERSSVERNCDVEGKTPTSEQKMDTKARIRAAKAARAAKRGPAPSVTSSQATPIKPSAVPPRINAEIAAESPARAGTPESSRHGGRSPSAVPAALPIQLVTQEEMNTSERYKTLVPQEKENPALRRQSTVTGTTSKEASKVGNFVHSVPIALMGHQRDSYPLMIQQHKDVIERFLATSHPTDELIIEIETLLERLRRITVHPDLDNTEVYTQYDVPATTHANWAIACSSKFLFLKHLIDELREKPVSIAVVCRSGQLSQIVGDFLRGLEVDYYKADTGQQIEQSSGTLSFKILSPNDDISSESLAADAIICLDNSAEAGGPAFKLLQDSSLIMMALVVPGTIEHVERCISPGLTQQQKLRALVHGIFDLRYESGKLEHGQLPSVETAKVLASFIANKEDATKEWSIPALSMLENLDSQTESDIQLPQSSAAVLGGDKRPFGTLDVEMPASTDTFKRPRLASNGVHAHDEPITINPLELDISHVSDSIDKPSGNNHIVDPSDLIVSSDINGTIERLRSLVVSTQAELALHKQDLSDLQYRYEDQRAQIVSLTRRNDAAIDTAQTAVTRMTEDAAKSSALRIENRSLKEQLKVAQEALTEHSIPERAELEKQRIAFAQSEQEKKTLEKRLEVCQKDLDYAQEMYQNSSSAAQHLGTANKDLEAALAQARQIASGEQARAKQMTLDARAQTLVKENKQLKATIHEQTEALGRKDRELALMKEASRGRMSTRGSSQPRSPRVTSPLKNAAGSRQSSPSASELRGKMHPLRQG